MVEVRNLNMTYQGFLAVDQVSFSLKKNTITALVGMNGAGKTSILKAISGLYREYDGEIFVDGRSVNAYSLEERVKRKILLIPEGREIFPNLTVKENILVGGHTLEGNLKEKVGDMLNTFPLLGEFQNKLAGKLSGGQQQFVAIARALVADPKILLVDEPTMGLTPKNGTLVMEYLKTLPQKGMTLFISSSQFKTTEFGFDQVLQLEHGRLKR